MVKKKSKYAVAGLFVDVYGLICLATQLLDTFQPDFLNRIYNILTNPISAVYYLLFGRAAPLIVSLLWPVGLLLMGIVLIVYGER